MVEQHSTEGRKPCSADSPKPDDLHGKRVVVMGLGQHGGGLAVARWLLKHGAKVTVTDLRHFDTQAEPLKSLKDKGVHFTLERHALEDFQNAYMVIKNPAVPRDSPLLAEALRTKTKIETDISLFLCYYNNPIIAVTGTKGKSTVASMIYAGLYPHDASSGDNTTASPSADRLPNDQPVRALGGNIGTSPLEFADRLPKDQPVVLELSSFQLGDLPSTNSYRDRIGFAGRQWPRVAVVTNLLPDHLDRYPNLDEYFADKQIIIDRQGPDDTLVCLHESKVHSMFRKRIDAQAGSAGKRHPKIFSVYNELNELPILEEDMPPSEKILASLMPRIVATPRYIQSLPHYRTNIRLAVAALHAYATSCTTPMKLRIEYSGLPHRMQYVGRCGGVSFFNDSTATIPQATEAACRTLRGTDALKKGDEKIVLIAGGSDKGVDMWRFNVIANMVDRLLLLTGEGSECISSLLRRHPRLFNKIRLADESPPLYEDLARCVEDAYREALPKGHVVLSPGCASFGMFNNEFDRGDRFVEAVKAIEGFEAVKALIKRHGG